MSANDEHSTVMRGVTHGACDFLIKPVRIEELKNIWQHVVRRGKHNAAVGGTVNTAPQSAQPARAWLLLRLWDPGSLAVGGARWWRVAST